MKNFKINLLLILAVVFYSCSGDEKPESIEASGTIEATSVVISSRSAGNVLDIKFEEGAKVKSGDTILVIDHELLDIQLAQAIAVQDGAEAQLCMMMKGARSEDILQAEQNLNQAKINYESALRDKNRLDKLFSSRSITQKQFEDAEARFDLMSAQLKTAQENFNKVKKIFRQEEIRQAKANYEKVAAGVELIKKNIRDCYVTAPIDGFIVKTFVETGEMVSPMSSLVKISELDRVELEIYVSTEELAFVKLNQSADISIDAYKNKTYRGKVVYISPEAEFTPKNIQTKDERTKLVFAVKIKIANPNYELKSGMPADAVIKL